MGPTYLVLLVVGSASLVLYEGTDADEANEAHNRGITDNTGRSDSRGEPVTGARIITTTVRAEAKLS